jgi:hypothetical protein
VAVRTTLPPVQKAVGPFAVIAAVGRAVTVTRVGAEVAVHPDDDSLMVTV